MNVLSTFKPLRRLWAVFAALLLTFVALAIPQQQSVASAQGTDLPADELLQAQAGVELAQTSGTGTCSVSVALVLDLSFPPPVSGVPVGQQEQDRLLAELKTELNSLVDSLEGTYSRVGLYTFSYYAPAGSNQDLPAVDMNDSASVAQLRDRIAAIDFEVPWFQQGLPRNWQGGLQSVGDDMAAGIDYSDVVLVTNGAANVFMGSSGNFPSASRANVFPYSTEQQELDGARAAKNRIEGYGADVTPVGIGQEVMDEDATVEVYVRRGVGWAVGPEPSLQGVVQTMATDQSEELQTFPSYQGLADWITESFTSGCFNIVHEVVDGDGTVLHPAEGVDYQITPAGMASINATTNAEGVADVDLAELTAATDITVQEQAREGFVSGAEPRCVLDSAGGTPISGEVTPEGNGIALNFDPGTNVTCYFQSRPLIPLELSKNTEITPTSLGGVLTNAQYDFDYVCTDVDGTQLAQGVLEGVTAGSPQLVANVPLGAECVIEERPIAVDETLMSVNTFWAATNATGNTGGITDREFTVTPDSRAYNAAAASAEPSVITVTNSYGAATAPVQVEATIANNDIPAGQEPTVIHVQASCRYIPDPTDLPEEGGNPNPIDLGTHDVMVPVGGAASVGDFPVGTQCSWTQGPETTADGDPTQDGKPSIPGYSLSTEWQSNVCFSERLNGAGAFVTCDSNYTWIPNDDSGHRLEIINTYQPQVATLRITKELAGAAAEAGTTTPYLFDVVCRSTSDPASIVFQTDAPVRVTAGSAATLEGVPVASDCEITERDVEIDNVVVTAAEPVTVTLAPEDANSVVDAPVMVNTLDYQTADVTIIASVDTSGVADLTEAAALQDATFTVSAQCHAGGEQVFNDGVGTVSDLGSLTFPEPLRLGTSCTFAIETVDTTAELADIDHVATFSPQPLVVSAEENTVQLRSVFTSSVGDLILTNSVGQSAPLLGADHLLPETFSYSVACTDGTFAERLLGPGEQAVIPGIAAGSSCEVTQSVLDPVELERTTTWAVPGETGQLAGDAVTFTFPDTGGATVSALSQYAPATSMMTLTAERVLVDGTGNPLDPVDPIFQAVMADNTAMPLSYQCTRDGVVVGEGTLTVPVDGVLEVPLPVGTDCVISADSRTIPSARFGETSYSGDGVASGSEFNVTVGTVGTQAQIEQSYQLLTGAFHLKKKVDGEGVTTIGADRMYQLDWECRLNDVVVQTGSAAMGRFDNAADNRVDGIPVGSDCAVTEVAGEQGLDPNLGTEPAAEDYAVWQARWDVTDGPTSWGENEQTCEQNANCIPAEQQNQVTVRVAPSAEEEAPVENFLGSLVVWNTYNYERRPIQVDKDLLGDGPVLAADDTFDFNLVCVDPRYADQLGGVFEPGSELPSTSFNEVVSVTGDGTAATVAEVPLGWDCVIREQQVTSHDATVQTEFAGATVDELATPADPTQPEGARTTFTTLAATEATGNTANLPALQVTVSNDYSRARAAVTVSTEYLDARPNSVHPYLNNSGAFQVEWTCTDPYSDGLGGTLEVPADGTPVEIRDGESQLPASATCDFTQLVDDKIPAGFEDSVQSQHTVGAQRAGTEVLPRRIGTSVTGVSLSPEATTEVAYQNAYWVPTMPLGLMNVVEGDPNGEVITNDTQFTFDYVCTVEGLLPGQDLANFGSLAGGTINGNTVSGSATVAGNAEWVANLPAGSTCEITNVRESAEAAAALDGQGLDLQSNYTYLSEEEMPPGENGEYGGRYPLNEADTLTLNQERALARLFHTVYRQGGVPVAAQTVNPDETAVPGASFAIHRANPALQAPIGDSVATGLGGVELEGATANLAPGSYYLVTDGGGVAGMSQPWRFDVVASNAALAEMDVRLGDYTQQTGMLAVAEPTETTPWILQVANLSVGVLPLTGDRGVWWTVGAGAGLLALAGLFLLRRRN